MLSLNKRKWQPIISGEKKPVLVYSIFEEEVCMCVCVWLDVILWVSVCQVLQLLLPIIHDFIHLWKGKAGLESQSTLVSFINVTKAIWGLTDSWIQNDISSLWCLMTCDWFGFVFIQWVKCVRGRALEVSPPLYSKRWGEADKHVWGQMILFKSSISSKAWLIKSNLHLIDNPAQSRAIIQHLNHEIPFRNFSLENILWGILLNQFICYVRAKH